MSPGMLRARRRDACLKPNRVLDKGSSRGMIYENEELRLRTINITSEIERGQSELKKLKRENDHLRREIWALRDEVDRLEALLKQKEQEEAENEEETDEEEEEDNGEEEAEPTEPHPRFLRLPRVTVEPDGLSVVPEESEDGSTPEPQTPINQSCLNTERQVEEYRGVLPPCIRLNCVHPYTTAATIKGTTLADITTVEVIECLGGSGGQGLVGVRLLEDCLYLSWSGKAELEAAVGRGLTLRLERLDLTDVSQGTVVLAMSAIPHSVSEQGLVRLLSQFGPVIGGIERRVYRGTDTGEGLARIRPLASLPKRLYLEGAEIDVRPLCHQELAKLSMEVHQVRPRPPSNLVLRTDKDEGKATGDSGRAGTSGNSSRSEQFIFPPTAPSTSAQSIHKTDKDEGKATGDSGRAGTSGNSSRSEQFVFPPTAPSTSAQSIHKGDERSQSAPVRTPEHGSASSLRPHSDSETAGSRRKKGKRGKSPSSGSEQESPAARPARRRASIVPPLTDRERSNSLSSRASYSKRKMSATGRESGKLPWCACWGNGCY